MKIDGIGATRGERAAPMRPRNLATWAMLVWTSWLHDIHWFRAPIAPIISILKWLMVKVKANMSSVLDKI
jgi:hypothetical protein